LAHSRSKIVGKGAVGVVDRRAAGGIDVGVVVRVSGDEIGGDLIVERGEVEKKVSI